MYFVSDFFMYVVLCAYLGYVMYLCYVICERYVMYVCMCVCDVCMFVCVYGYMYVFCLLGIVCTCIIRNCVCYVCMYVFYVAYVRYVQT